MNENPSNLFVAIDRSDQKLSVAESDALSAPKLSEISSSPEEIHAWILDKLEQTEGLIFIAFENPAPNLICAFVQYERIIQYPLNPASTDNFRKAFAPSMAKDDGTDALSMLDMLIKHQDNLRPLKPETSEIRLLKSLVNDRRQAVDIGTMLNNILIDQMKRHFPQALNIFDDITSSMACAFLKKWPTLQQAQSARPETLRKFFYLNHSRSEKLVEKRIGIIKNSQALTHDYAILEASKIHILTLIDQINANRRSVEVYTKKTKEIFSNHQDAFIFNSLPGAGEVMAPRLLAAFGSLRENFPEAADMQKFSGIAPVMKRSGKKEYISRRWRRPKFIHQTFVEFAQWSAIHCKWAKAYAKSRKDEGMAYWSVMRTLAYKWIRIIHTLWTKRCSYDELVHVKNLIEQGSRYIPSPCE